MAEASFLQQNRARPGAALTVVLMHGAALAALLLIEPEIAERLRPARPIVVENIPVPPPPPPPPVERSEPIEQPRIVDAWVPPIPPARGIPTTDTAPPDRPALDSRPGGDPAGSALPPTGVAPRPTPARVAAQMIAGNLQPPYPASEQRMEREGRVVIQVTVGADGRVVSTRRLSATSDAFWLATERHARRAWRFRPATVDGRPIESTRTLTVHFELAG